MEALSIPLGRGYGYTDVRFTRRGTRTGHLYVSHDSLELEYPAAFKGTLALSRSNVRKLLIDDREAWPSDALAQIRPSFPMLNPRQKARPNVIVLFEQPVPFSAAGIQRGRNAPAGELMAGFQLRVADTNAIRSVFARWAPVGDADQHDFALLDHQSGAVPVAPVSALTAAAPVPAPAPPAYAPAPAYPTATAFAPANPAQPVAMGPGSLSGPSMSTTVNPLGPSSAELGARRHVRGAWLAMILGLIIPFIALGAAIFGFFISSHESLRKQGAALMIVGLVIFGGRMYLYLNGS